MQCNRNTGDLFRGPRVRSTDETELWRCLHDLRALLPAGGMLNTHFFKLKLLRSGDRYVALFLFKDKEDKVKEALFNVAYNVTDNISSRAILRHNNYIFNRYLPVFISLAQPLFMRASARELLVPFLHLWYGAAAGFEPSTSRSESGRSTNWAIEAVLYYFVCLLFVWFFTSHQQSFSYKGKGLPVLNQF